jgi:hypothetical protein
LEFFGGFVGVRQDPSSLLLRPEIGWAVREQNGWLEANSPSAGSP